jgi:Fic family protein
MDQTGTAAIRRRQILEALQGQAGGLTRQDLQAQASLQSLDEQAVRRLLAQLVEQGVARVAGQTKARRYFLGPAAPPPAIPEKAAEQMAEPCPRLSPEGLACRAFLAQPASRRPPASYQRAFLEAYRPNETCYLPEDLRQKLAALAGPGRPVAAASCQLGRRQLVDLAWDSARLEGGGYSRPDAEQLIEHGTPPAGRTLHDTQVVLNHRASIEFLTEPGQDIAVDPTTVRNLSALLTENLLGNPMDEGRLRSGATIIPGTTYIPPAAPLVIAACFRQLLATAAEITDPFEQSFFLLVHLAYLHPFSGGNPATARLAANIPMLRRNLAPVLFMGVPAQAFTEAMFAICERNQVGLLRDLFVSGYERSCARHAVIQAPPGSPDPFRLRYRAEIKAIVRAVVLAGDSMAEAERRIRGHAQATLPREDRAPFLVAVETELASLHDGNFARYQLRPSEFAAWKPRMERSDCK